MNEFNRILNRKDVPLHMVIQVVDHRCERGGLTGTGWTSHQDQAPGSVDDIPEDRWRTNIFESPYRIGDSPESTSDATIVMEAVDTKPGQTLNRIGIINFQVRFKITPVLIAHRAVNQFLKLRSIQGRQRQTPNIAIHTNHGWQSG